MEHEIALSTPIRRISMQTANLLVAIENLCKHAPGQHIHLYSDDLAALRDAYLHDPLDKSVLTFNGLKLVDGGPRK